MGHASRKSEAKVKPNRFKPAVTGVGRPWQMSSVLLRVEACRARDRSEGSESSSQTRVPGALGTYGDYTAAQNSRATEPQRSVGIWTPELVPGPAPAAQQPGSAAFLPHENQS